MKLNNVEKLSILGETPKEIFTKIILTFDELAGGDNEFSHRFSRQKEAELLNERALQVLFKLSNRSLYSKHFAWYIKKKSKCFHCNTKALLHTKIHVLDLNIKKEYLEI
jgi:spore coat polysaccharide biosynthesis protein SpsF (cytidylyltransferase family)